MLQLCNSTPFAANMATFPDEKGIDTLYLIVRATFNIGQPWTLTECQPAPETEDIYWGEPLESSIKYAGDYHTGKPSTDIVMVGHAFSPHGRALQQLDASLSVGKVSKSIRIFGDRLWNKGRITEPASFISMPVVYENAYGGQQVENGEILSFQEDNPLGKGYAGSCSVAQMDGRALPNLENPLQLISSLDDEPEPACFAFCSANWQSRVRYAGSYDENWKKNSAPYLPDDFDSRFFNMAHKDLIYPGYLQGGEDVTIENMHPEGNLQFAIPLIKLFADLNIGDRCERTGFKMETLLLEPNQLRLSMVFKSSFPIDRELLKIRQVKIQMGER